MCILINDSEESPVSYETALEIKEFRKIVGAVSFFLNSRKAKTTLSIFELFSNCYVSLVDFLDFMECLNFVKT